MATLQSLESKEIFKLYNIPLNYLEDLNTVIVIDEEDGNYYTFSTAFLTVTRYLKWPYPALYSLIIVPRLIRDKVYEFIATNRYEWFGHSDVCRALTEDDRNRFLSIRSVDLNPPKCSQ